MNRLLRLAMLAFVTLSLAGALVPHGGTARAQGTATLEVTLRGCNEGVDPRVGNPATTCTTPLDAPDEAGAIWGGDGQGGMPFADMTRQNDGTYEVQIPANREVELVNMFPSLRNAYIVPELGLEITAPFNDPPVVQASAGETVSLHFYYFYYPETSATMTILMRGCPEGFDPAADEFFDDCTTPLDAPDAAFISWGGDGQGGMEISALDREANGAYVYEAGTFTMNVEIGGLAPVVHDTYQVFGFNSVSGDTYTFNLDDGETREVFVFYYDGEGGSGPASLDLTLRACPDGVDPSTVANPAISCTIPLDAPDAAGVIWGGDGQGGIPVLDLPRLYDGTYHLEMAPADLTITLVGFEPSVRNAYIMVGADGVDGSGTYYLDLAPGEAAHVFVFYYNE